MKEIVRRYKYRIYPSASQASMLAVVFGGVRFVYNEFLLASRENRSEGTYRLLREEMQDLLPTYKEAFPFLENVPSQSLQVATHDLDVAYQNCKQGRAKPPKLKKKKSRQSFQLPQPRIKEVSGQMCIFLPVQKTWIPILMHRELPHNAKLGAATITKTPTGKYFVSFVVTTTEEINNKPLISKSTEMVGVDLNIKEYVLSNGERIQIPKYAKILQSRKRRLEKSLARKLREFLKTKHGVTEGQFKELPKKKRAEIMNDFSKNRSRNYEKTRVKLAEIHEKITNIRNDFLRKTALKLYRENQAVAMETLNVKGMMKNRRLARSIAFQSWGRLLEIMKFYAVQHGKQLHQISMWFPSSKMCHDCGFVNQELKLSDRTWTCESCGAHHDRDLNAAKNIKREGGSYPAYKPVESKGSARRPKGRRAHPSSAKQESSKLPSTLVA